MHGEDLNNSQQIIKPVDFRSNGKHQRSGPMGPIRWLIWFLLGVVILILAVGVWFVFSARQVIIDIQPEPERIGIGGSLLTPRFHSYFLLRPGEYNVTSEKECYHPFAQSFNVTSAKSQQFNFAMEQLPGLLTLDTHQEGHPDVAVEGADVLIDGMSAGLTPLKKAKLAPGRRIIEIQSSEYQPAKTELAVDGCNKLQTMTVPLVPAWSETTISSIPQGVSVSIDGKDRGSTPVTLKLFAGEYALELQAELFKNFTTKLEIPPNNPQHFGPFELQPADGILNVETVPPGVSVSVDDQFVGMTPLRVSLSAHDSHQILFSKAGYEKTTQELNLGPGKTEKIQLTLEPIKGIINLSITPPDADLFINNKKWKTPGQTNQRQIALLTVPHQVEVRKEGYLSFKKQVTPHDSFPLELIVALERKGQVGKNVARTIRAANGYQLNLISPEPFTMGSSRREQGRRSNETLRKIMLKRPFYMGTREVTNQEFRAFANNHDSGYVGSQSLNGDNMPVVMVTWQQAAEFCNWMSKKDGLPAVYVKQNGTLTTRDPIPSGYRLPTEAEWEYSARKSKSGSFMKYPWGDKFPPPEKFGNFADVSAKSLVGFSLENYNDGYKATAPPGVFGINALGIADLGGNVAEWCHDNYTIYPLKESYTYEDPTGPEEGGHHVVKGSSWKHASISTLRISYRDYSKDKRHDIGFRLCRYVNEGSPGK